VSLTPRFIGRPIRSLVASDPVKAAGNEHRCEPVRTDTYDSGCQMFAIHFLDRAISRRLRARF
jgi:hypothetical protein